MRAGGCSVQHTLSAEAAAVVKQAVSLARRRGHAQVTPLHVAITLLMSGSFNLLRKACLQSHSHPLQYRVLELCFNVALNRLPTITSTSPVVPVSTTPTAHHHGHHSHVHGILQGPSLSNALVAAFKRAQANQRRGCLEQQQQQQQSQSNTTTTTTNNNPQQHQHTQQHNQSQGVKVEMEQLIISILDDPSVSRVMREAGFSSSVLKHSLEEALQSHELVVGGSAAAAAAGGGGGGGFMKPSCVIQAKPISWRSPNNPGMPLPPYNPTLPPPHRHCCDSSSNFSDCKPQEGDVMAVLESLVSQRKSRNTVVVGECLSTAEHVVKETVLRIKSEKAPEELKNVEFLNPQLSGLWFRVLDRYQLEERLFDLNRAVVTSACEGRGAILYLGDLRWALDGLNAMQDHHYSNPGFNSYPNSYNSYYCPVKHAIMELGRMVSRHANSRRLWVLATATYQTYLSLQKTQPWLESLWGFHPVTVPALSLSLDATSITKPTTSSEGGARSGSSTQEQWKNDYPTDQLQEKSGCVDYCSADSRSHNNRPIAAQIQGHAQEDMEEDHGQKNNSSSSNNNNHHDNNVRAVLKFPISESTITIHQFLSAENHSSLITQRGEEDSDKGGEQAEKEEIMVVGTTLALANTTTSAGAKNPKEEEEEEEPEQVQWHGFSSSSTSRSRLMEVFDASSSSANSCHESSAETFKKLSRELQRRVRGYAEIIPRVVSAVLMSMKRKKKCWLLFHGPDEGSKLSMAYGLAKFIFGSESNLIRFRPTSTESRLDGLMRIIKQYNSSSSVIFLEDFHRADLHSVSAIVDSLSSGVLSNENDRVVISDSIFVLSMNSTCSGHQQQQQENQRERSSICRWKRKAAEEWEDHHKFSQEQQQKQQKRSRSSSSSLDLDLNASADSLHDVSSNVFPMLERFVDLTATFAYSDMM